MSNEQAPPESPSWTKNHDNIAFSPTLDEALEPGTFYVAQSKANPKKKKNFMWMMTRKFFLTDKVIGLAATSVVVGIASRIAKTRDLAIQYLPAQIAQNLGWIGIGGVVAAAGAFAANILGFRNMLYSNARHEYDPQDDVRRNAEFKDPKLLAKVPDFVKTSYNVFQPIEGYCGHASIINVLQSTGHKLLRVPSQPEPLDVADIVKILKRFYGDDKVDVVSASDKWTFDEFMNVFRESNNDNTRLVLNYTRAPTFYFDPKHPDPEVTAIGKFFGGHFVNAAGVVKDDKGQEWCCVWDPNEKYGLTCYPPVQLFNGTNTRSPFSKEERGFIRVRV